MTRLMNVAGSPITRRGALKGAALVAVAPVVAVSSGPAFALVSQASVAYRGTPNDGHDCSNCGLFVAPAACKSVAGAVSPSGWCKIWIKKG